MNWPIWGLAIVLIICYIVYRPCNSWVKFVQERSRHPLRGSSDLVDKIKVKEIVGRLNIPRLRILKTYAVVDDPNDIDENLINYLPSKYVMKLNNGSGRNYLVTTYETPETLRILARKWMKYNGGGKYKEMQYAGVKNKILFEEYLPVDNPPDYKFHVLHGVPRFCQVVSDRYTNKRIEFINIDKFHHPQMVQIVQRLGQAYNFDYVRIDLYNIDGEIYFGEFTFTPDAGKTKFSPDAFNNHLVECIKNKKLELVIPNNLSKS